MIDEALDYAKHGFAVFPLQERSKKPITAHGVSDATKSEAQIKKWWSRWPNANIGIACGRASGNLVVIDLDNDNNKGVCGYHVLVDWEQQHGELPETVRAVTGRGGYHFYFKTDGRKINNAVGVFEGVDIRGEGGYIVAPPSIHENGRRYEWEIAPDDIPIAEANDLVYEFLRGPEKKKSETERFKVPEKIPSGRRTQTLFKLACSLHSRGLTDTAIKAAIEEENRCRCQPPLSDEEIRKEILPALGRYEKGKLVSEKGKDVSEVDKLQFHHLNEKGVPTGVFDVRIENYIIEHQKMFVLGAVPYVYRNGAYFPDWAKSRLSSAIRELIFDFLIRSTTIDRIFRLFLVDERLQKNFDELNTFPPEWINFENGMFDPVHKRLLPHSENYFCLNQIPHEYHPDRPPEEGKETEKYLDFICDGDPDLREMLLQYIGLCLTPDSRQQKFLLLVGEGGGGKSTLIRLVEMLVGSRNVSNVSLNDLQQRFSSIELMGKLVNSCADLEISALTDVSVVKKIVGEDKIKGEKKGKDPIFFKNFAKLIFSVNELPIVKGEKTNAFYRRLLVFPMKKIPKERDPNLFEKLVKEADYLLWLAVSALERMYARGVITIAAASTREIERLRADSDTVEGFLTEECEMVEAARYERTELYGGYKAWCEENERQALTKNSFYRSLRTKGFKEITSCGKRYFLGLKPALENCTNDGFMSVTQNELPFD